MANGMEGAALVLERERSEALSARLREMATRGREYAEQPKAPATLRAYQSDWRHFDRWCQEHGLGALPACEETVALYLTDLAETHRTATLQRRLSSIAQVHKAAGLGAPTKGAVALVWQGIKRAKGTAQEGKAPARTDDIRRMVAACTDDTLGVRDRALLLLGFAGAFRRSELVGLDVADLGFGTGGLTVTIRHSKTDQEGAGQRVGIPYGSNPETCPMRHVQAWLNASTITAGPVFRGVNRWGQVAEARLSDRAVALVVKHRAELAGLDPARFAGHSLRAGLATSAAEAGVGERAIMNQTRHKSLPMLRRYIREGNLFRENAAGHVGL